MYRTADLTKFLSDETEGTIFHYRSPSLQYR